RRMAGGPSWQGNASRMSRLCCDAPLNADRAAPAAMSWLSLIDCLRWRLGMAVARMKKVLSGHVNLMLPGGN
ncbi:MAG: hypothetical protein ABIT83_06695, partial [Massilia sp.]